MNLKQINVNGGENGQEQLVSGKKYLCGYVSSGDHPIAWDVFLLAR